jgi:hypothetical protein
MKLPSKVAQIKRWSLISLGVFFFFQIGGVWLLFQDVNYLSKNLSLDTLSLPSIHHTSFEDFLSGTSLSMTSGFWLSVTLAAYRLKRPYHARAYRIVIWSYIAQILFFALSFNGIFTQHKSLLNPGTLGTIITIAATTPIFLKARDPIVRAWSTEFLPPPPILPPSAYGDAEEN